MLRNLVEKRSCCIALRVFVTKVSMDILITPFTVNHNGLGFGDVVFEVSTQFNFFFHADSSVRVVSCHLEGMNCLRLFIPATKVSY